MRAIVLLLLLPLALLAADHKKPARPARSTAPAKTAEPAIPRDAVEIGPDAYRYTDKDGKTWIYRRTPFGVSKQEQKAEAKPEPPPAPTVPVTVSVEGDQVRFERKSPFGKQVWTKKRSELTEEEAAWLAAKEKNEGSATRTKAAEQ
jgi:hypothetical protein